MSTTTRPAHSAQASPGQNATSRHKPTVSPDETLSPAETPTLRQALRRGSTWIVFGFLVLVVAFIVLNLQGSIRSPGIPLGADNPEPGGSKALVEVLRHRGVKVTDTDSLPEALKAAPKSTVLIYDSDQLVTEEDLTRLIDRAKNLVIVDPSFTIGFYTPGINLAGHASGALLNADCELPAARKAKSLSVEQDLFDISETAKSMGWYGCFPDKDAGFGLVVGKTAAGGDLYLVGASTVFQNSAIDQAGNAALALGITGQLPELVWFVPTSTKNAPPPGPEWTSPVVLLGIAVVIVAAVWRGRRFGPLVIEDLPVEVAAGETAVGRARLYARGNNRGYALNQIRSSTRLRLARVLQVDTRAGPLSLINTAAYITGRSPKNVQDLLLDRTPSSDRELVDLSVALSEFEAEVGRAIHPNLKPPTS